jgi:hypothetical protein
MLGLSVAWSGLEGKWLACHEVGGESGNNTLFFHTTLKILKTVVLLCECNLILDIHNVQ